MGSSERFPPELARSAFQIVEAVTGVAPTRVVNIPRGVLNWKFDVALGSGERFIVRFYPPGREGLVHYEPDLLRRAADAGVEVPQVVTDARSGPDSPLAYVLYRRLEGFTLAERWDALGVPARKRVAADLWSALARLHTLAIDGWGELRSASRAQDRSWSDFVCRALDEGMTVARGVGGVSEDLLDAIVAIRGRIDALAPSESSGVVWADVSPENVLVDAQGRLAGLLDFESCIGAELCANLGYCFAAQLGTGFYEALRDAWGEDENEAQAARTELYSLVRGMRIAKFADRGPLLPSGEPRPPLEESLPGLRAAAESLGRRLGCRG